MADSRIPRLVRNTGILLNVEVFSRFVGIILFMVAGRKLGPEGIGLYGLALALGGIFSQLPLFGFEKLISREVAKDLSRAGFYLGRVVILKTILAIMGLVLIVPALIVMGYEFDRGWIVMVVCATIFSQTFITYYNAFYRTFSKVEYEAIVRISLSLVTTGLGLYVLYSGYGLPGFVISQLVSTLLCLFLSNLIVGRKIAPFHFGLKLREATSVLKSALPLVLLGVLVMLYVSIGVIVLSQMKGDYSTGIYTAAAKIWMVFVFIPAGMMGVYLPTMSRRFQENSTDFVKIYWYAFKYLFIVGIFLAVTGQVIADRLVVFLYGNQFLESAYPLRILAWGMLISFLNFALVNTAVSVGKEKKLALLAFVGVLFNLSLNLALVPRWSYHGTAIALVSTELLLFVLNFALIRKLVSGEISWSNVFVKPLVSMAIALVVMLSVLELHFILSAILGGVTFTALLFILRSFDSVELGVLKSFLGVKAGE